MDILWSGCGAWASGNMRPLAARMTVLPSLTHETHNDLGVTSVGHRLKLLDAIAAPRGHTGGKAPSAAVTTAPSTPSVSPEDRAERSQ
jgi:SAM domain (Sterile alpha motif)